MSTYQNSLPQFFFQSIKLLKTNEIDGKLNFKECPICYQEFINNKIIYSCKHEVCFNCFIKILNTTNSPSPLKCFYCRSHISGLAIANNKEDLFYKKLFFGVYNIQEEYQPVYTIHLFIHNFSYVLFLSFAIFYIYIKTANFYHNQDML